MNTITLSSQMPSVMELLDKARQYPLFVKTEAGDIFVVSTSDSFDTEVELLRNNHKFLTMLDRFKSEEHAIPIEEVEQHLR